ncbi:MAG: DUF6171 family protein [Clostridia bacterium]|jgi:hypothetical protein
MKPFCKRCFLNEIDEDMYKGIYEYISSLSEDIRTEEKEYATRLSTCRQCDSLMEGTCVKCGCFAEVRAAKKNMHCPSEEHFW